jgi:hypothetical protein
MLDNDGFAEDGDLGDDDDFYFKHYAVDYSCVVDQDSDGDGLTDRQEAYVHNTEPRLPDTDRDGLSDGLEVSTLGTDPLAADIDGDGVPDGDEDTDGDGLADGAEVNTHGTDPADADSDDDLLADGLEVAHGVDLRDPDSDDDGLPDGQDVEFIQNAVLALPTSDFRPPGRGTRNAMLSILDGAESKLLQGDVDGATKLLTNLRTQLDGCGGAPDNNDCADQTAIRGLLDQLLSNLES